MGGIDNDVVYGTNLDFSGAAQVAAQMTVDGQLLIGATGAQPNTATLTAQYGTNITNAANAISLRATVNTAYVVDPVAGNAPYAAVQAAMDAASTAGGGLVFVRLGMYVENLTFYDTVRVEGQGNTLVFISGIHMPPATGVLNVSNIAFMSATDIFYSAAAGTSTIIADNVLTNCTNGYTFNLPNWVGGDIYCNRVIATGDNDGILYNTDDLYLRAVNSYLGDGATNVLTTNSGIDSNGTEFDVPITVTGASTSNFVNTKFRTTIQFTGGAAAGFNGSRFDTGANPAINHTSMGILQFTGTEIDSSAATVITGTGTIQVASLSFINNDVIEGTITVNEDSFLHTPEIVANNIIRQGFSGFYEWGGAGNYYSVVGTTFTLLREGVGYIQSRRITWTAPQNTGALTKGDTYFIYVDETGTIGAANARSTALFQDNIVLFEMLADNDTPSNTVVVRENHPYDFPTAPSEWGHNIIGSVITNINNGANILLHGTKAIQISGADELDDHGLTTVIPDSGAAAVSFNFMNTDGTGKWILDSTANTFPSEYNNAGTVQALGASKYGVFRLYVSKDDLNTATPTYFAVFDDAQYNNLTLAQTAIANDSHAQATTELGDLELTQLGHVIKAQATDTIVDVIIEKETARTTFTAAGSNQASLILTDTTNFDHQLSAIDTTVQAALETLDEIWLTWTEVVGTTQSADINNGYITNNVALVTVTLPATATVGDRVAVQGKGAGLWRIAQNAGQTIHFGNQDTTAGVGGRLDATNRYDAIEIICVTANTDFAVRSSIGNIGVT